MYVVCSLARFSNLEIYEDICTQSSKGATNPEINGKVDVEHKLPGETRNVWIISITKDGVSQVGRRLKE